MHLVDSFPLGARHVQSHAMNDIDYLRAYVIDTCATEQETWRQQQKSDIKVWNKIERRARRILDKWANAGIE